MKNPTLREKWHIYKLIKIKTEMNWLSALERLQQTKDGS